MQAECCLGTQVNVVPDDRENLAQGLVLEASAVVENFGYLQEITEPLCP